MSGLSSRTHCCSNMHGCMNQQRFAHVCNAHCTRTGLKSAESIEVEWSKQPRRWSVRNTRPRRRVLNETQLFNVLV